jgi:aromatic-L-amino-acid decarboxylase
MELEEFRKHGHRVVDWMADYLENVEEYPVMSRVSPGQVADRLPVSPPPKGEPFDRIMADFQELIVPGMTHWQHPSFFAYFPANSSPPSVLAEMLTATLGAQCMVWQTSPAAAELEERVMEWLGDMLGLPRSFVGVIQDSASTSTLCSLLTARERASDYSTNKAGMAGGDSLTAYCSTETHSSIEKGVRIAGIGSDNLRKIAVDEEYAMVPEDLESAIERDIGDGLVPTCVVATIGTTGSTAIDPLKRIGEICARHGVWLHVDAALAGTALLLPECRWMIEGIEHADSFVFNPHKWMFTNFDCSAYFVRDPDPLVRTFQITPEYLKTGQDRHVKNYRDWGIQLGRRFRALKLWFVIRSYGVEGLQGMVQEHIRLAKELSERIDACHDFELLAPVPLNTVCFRYRPQDAQEEELNALNAALLERLNRTGRVYMTHTKLGGKYTLRLVVGQTYVAKRHVEKAWDLITETARAGS